MDSDPATARPDTEREPSRPAKGRSDALRPELRSAIPPFAALRAFEAVGSTGGIRRAASVLSVDHAAVSRHVRALEKWTGIALFDRSAGSHGLLTEQGRAYHQRITRALIEIGVATQDLMHLPDDRRLRLWCAPGLASAWLSGRLGRFSSDHPEIELELQPSEIMPDFDANEADIYLHYVIDGRSEELSASLRSIEIARPPILAVASAGFVARSVPLHAPRDLAGSLLLHEANTDQWLRWFAQHGIADIPPLGGPKFWQNHLTLSAALGGQGIALGNALIVGDDLDSSRLVAIGRWRPVYLGSYYFTARRDSWRSTAIAAFRRWLEKNVAVELAKKR